LQNDPRGQVTGTERVPNITDEKRLQQDDVHAALGRILSDAKFSNSPRMQELLSHLVVTKLNGQEDSLKGYNIALDVFGRSSDFDPDTDSLVRVQAGRLRTALTSYYEGNGASEPLRIEIPKGTYVPSFQLVSSVTVANGIEPKKRKDRSRFTPSNLRKTALVFAILLLPLALYVSGLFSDSVSEKPSINTLAVLPIASDNDDDRHQRIANSLTVDLVRTFENGNFFSVAKVDTLSDTNKGNLSQLARKLNVRFLLTGSFMHQGDQDDDKDRLTLSLVDGSSGFTAWSESYNYPHENNGASYKKFLEQVSFDLNPAYYAAAKKIVESEGAEKSSAVELFLISNWVPGTAVSSLEWELERVSLARQALEADPDYGPAHSVLADKLAYLATIDPPSDTEALRTESAQHATMALSSAGQSADALFNMAIHKLHLGQIEQATLYASRTADLDPKNALARFFTKAMPYTCRPSSDEMLADFVDFHNGLNPRSPVRWITAHIIGRVELNRKNYAEAVQWGRQSEKIFQSPDTGYQLAAALVQINDVKAAQAIFDKQNELWPNLDPNHFAEIAIPRRCGLAEDGTHLQSVYRQMAKALN